MDVFGFRVVVDQADDCYRALGIVHNLYKPVAGRFKDYIAIPRRTAISRCIRPCSVCTACPSRCRSAPNTWTRSRKTASPVIGLYKSEEEGVQSSQRRARQWVRDLLDLQQRAGNPMEFIESLKIDLFPDEVYVFTPRRARFWSCPEVPARWTSPTPCIPTCRQPLRRVSDRPQPGAAVPTAAERPERGDHHLWTKPVPNPDWLTFVVTSSKARTGIRQALEARNRIPSPSPSGRQLLNRSLASANKSINDLDFRRLRRVFKEFGVKRLDEVLAAIGNGQLMSYAVAQRLLAEDDPDFEGVTGRIRWPGGHSRRRRSGDQLRPLLRAGPGRCHRRPHDAGQRVRRARGNLSQHG